MPDTFNPDLLRVARQARAWSQAELARRATLSQAHLSKLENGLLEPSGDVLPRLAQALDFPESLFRQSDRIIGLPMSVHPMYRKKASVGQRAIDKLEAELNLRILHMRRLLQAAEFEPELPLPRLDPDEYDDDPERIAGLVRATWGIPSGPLRELVRWVEQAGCIVVSCDFSGLSVDGVTVQAPGLPPCIFLNRYQPADRQRFSVAHELGHIVMHRVPSPAMEEEANAFASALLMPRREIRSALSGRLTLQRLAALKPVWRVSMQALLFRAKTVGAITPNQSQYLWRQISAMGYRKSEPPELDFPAEAPSVMADILRVHLEELGYSFEELGSILHMNSKDIEKMYLLEKEGRVPRLSIVR